MATAIFVLLLLLLAAPGASLALAVGRYALCSTIIRGSTSTRWLVWTAATVICGISGWSLYVLGRVPVGIHLGLLKLAVWWIVSSFAIPLALLLMLTSSEKFASYLIRIARVLIAVIAFALGYCIAQATDSANRGVFVAPTAQQFPLS